MIPFSSAMAKVLPCRLCGAPIEIPAKYARAQSAVHPDCEAFDKYLTESGFDDLWAEFCSAQMPKDVSKLPDDYVIPRTSVTLGDLRRYARELDH